MTQDELYAALAADVKDEYKDVLKYVDLSKVAASYNLDGTAQILKDIAHEEYIHAEHLENILKGMAGMKEANLDLKKNARAALDSL